MDESTRLVSALGVLYGGPSSSSGASREEWQAADAWLQSFQAGSTAWSVCDAALHAPDTSPDVRYFCAQTLRTKVARDYFQLPPGDAPYSLRDSLVALLVRYATGPRVISSQLSLALAALAVHMEDWTETCLGWLDESLRQKAGCPGALLDVLSELPYETNSRGVAVRPRRRQEFTRQVLRRGAMDVLQLVAQMMASEVSQAACLGCFASWLPLAFEESGLERRGAEVRARVEALGQSPWVSSVVGGLRNEDDDVFGKAVDAAVELVRASECAGVASAEGGALAGRLVHEFMEVARARAPAALQEEDFEVAKGVCRVLAEAGEVYVDALARDPVGPDALSFVEGLLTFAGHAEADIAAITHTFFHRLAQALGDDPGEGRSRAAFLPSFRGLVHTAMQKLAYPPDFVAAGGTQWRPDERDDFKQNRNALAETLSDAARVVGAEDALRQLSTPLLADDPRTVSWQTREAALHGVRSLSLAVEHSADRGASSDIVPTVLRILPNLPDLSVPPVLYTTCLVISHYSRWLHTTAHGAGGALLFPLVQLVCTSGLTSRDVDVGAAAAMALNNLCGECRGELSAHVDSLLPVYERVLANCHARSSGASAESLEGPGAWLTLTDVLEVVEAFAHLTSALPIGQLSAVLNRLCDPLLQRIAAIASASANPSEGQGDQAGGAAHPDGIAPGNVSNELVMLLDALAALFEHTNPSALPQDYVHPTAAVVQRLFPSLTALLQTYPRDGRLMEHVCRCLKYALRSTQLHFAPLLPALSAQLAQSFHRDPQSCYLYLASQCVKIFGAEAAYETPLAGCVSALMGRALQLLPSGNDIDANPDVADDLFDLGVTVLRGAPSLLFALGTDPLGLLGPLLNCALEGVTVQHREACLSALRFLTYALDLATGANRAGVQAMQHAGVDVQALFAATGPVLVRRLISGVAGALPRDRLPDVADIFFSLGVTFAHGLGDWLSVILHPVPDDAVPEEEKGFFVNGVLAKVVPFVQAGRSVSDPDARRHVAFAKESIEDLLEDFADVCRCNDAARRATLVALAG